MDDIKRVAIVNRGEAAMRVLRAVAEYDRETSAGIRTIALYTDPDAASWFVRDADEVHHLGPATAVDAEGKRRHVYLDRERLLAALAAVRADAVWVGWGFVAEDAEFAQRCEKAGITFIGPPSEVIRRLGNKVTAKELAEEASVPVGTWSGRPVEDAEDAAVLAADLGYPLLIKAASGGGGRGIRRAEREEDLAGALASARAEAELAFGDPTVFLERLVGDAHHVEVQVIGDAYGTVWAAGVRDCSLQRRNQKILEESATVSVPQPLRERMKADAVRLCQESGYRNAGTVEFLYDASSQAYQFMEVNTRLQVEHPVTELTTGLDLVKLQFHVARGGRLEGDPPPETGHAVEVRLNAEDPERGFAPAPGRLEFLRMPAGPGIRVDTGIAQGDVIAGEFDAMVAKLLAWGRNRAEALARLRRALLETVVIVHGGTTNKAFLLTLLDRPEVIEGRVDTGWLDRLTRSGQHVPPHHGSCLVAAAIEAYEADHAAERTRFLRSAARGRPELSDELGHQVELRFRGQTYPLIVHRIGPGRYRLDTGGGVVDAALERLNTYERRLELNGSRLKVIADVQGPTYQIELEGVPHRIERDDGGFVRSPAPAVVISFAVAEGDQVATGEPVALIESMKMETTVHAPFPGRVRRLLSAANAQVDAGAPLVQLEPLGVAREGDGAGRVRFDGAYRTAEDDGSVEQRCAALLRSLRSHLLGYDLDRMTDQRLTYELPAACAALRDDGTVLGLEREILGIYADLGQLSRRSPGLGDEEESATGASPREYLLTYLRSVDRAEEILPERFLNRLRRALQRYDVASLDRTPALEEALVWMYRAFLRLPRLTPAVAAILDRWLARGAELSAVVGDGLRDLLDRVVDAAEGRAPTVADLARQVRFRLVDQPLLERARQAQYAAMDAAMAAIEQHPARADREELVEQLVACPQPLRPLLLRHGLRVDAPDMREVALEVRIKRFYRIRDLSDIRFVQRDRHLLGVADYVHEGRMFHLVSAYARWEDCDGTLAATAGHVAGVERDRRVIVDLTLQHADRRIPIDVLERKVRLRVGAVPFDRDLHRVDATVTFAGREAQHRRTSHLTFRQRDGRLEEDPLYRNLHPMLAKRVGVWRLRNFAIERLPSAEDVYLFLGTGKDNPGDRRLFALAEVRDLIPVMDRDGRIAALPHLERMVMESFSAMREYLSRQPVGQRPARNRLILDVRPPSTVPPEQWRDLAHRLAPGSAGLDVEKVVVWGQVPDGGGGFEDAVLHVENVGERGVVVRREPPSDEPVATLNAYRQKVLKTERRGGVYPYELVTRLTPREGAAADFPPGEFAEHDLDEEGRLRPVDRPYGQNTANLVVGLITNRTAKVPEGLRRVIIIGDPSRSLGSLAEPECRRIIAALDLAEALLVPVEWFAVSSGARIAMDSGTENMDWIAAVLRRLIECTQAG
ncbi:MAG: hypothetical protein GEU81_12505, partial [Nitriliruptorales bacterium]|nr:hypothetical protein [Nitriliruptorales bacterium]